MSIIPVRTLARWAERVMTARIPDFVIGEPERPYLLRWWVIPRNRLFNVYLHQTVRSDDDRALHDHPWLNCSILLAGRYAEHTILGGGIEHREERAAGSVTLRRSVAAHRLEIMPGERAISLFITGPRIRDWGFHCPKGGWTHWKLFTGGKNGELVGRGCGEADG
jgi:hypothetical protein